MRPRDAVFVRIWAAVAISCHHLWFCFAACFRCAMRRRAGAASAALRSPIPWRLRELDRGRFGLGRACLRRRGRPMRRSPTASCLRCRRWLPSARRSTPSSTDTSQRHKADLPDETIGVGTSFDFQLFDRAWLYSPDTRFVLAGIVNRMDRAYLSEANCGEIRLIYRLTRTDCPGRRSRGLAAAADDAQPRAEGQGRSCGRRRRQCRTDLRRDRASVACGGRLGR